MTDADEKNWLERISCHEADASITPLILSVSKKAIVQKDRNDLFELLEKLNFRFYGTRIAGRADTGQGELFGYAHNFFNKFGKEEGEKKVDIQWLKEKLICFVDQRANDKSFVKSLILDKDEARDYYNWSSLKFFLASYEEKLKNKKRESINLQQILAKRNAVTPNDFYHKEHIWAIGDHTKKIDHSKNLDINKRRLGNFLLLKETINIQVSNDPIEDKVTNYFEDSTNAPNTLMIRELRGIFNKATDKESTESNWKRKNKNYWRNVYTRFLDKREEKMINFALKRWKVPKLNSNISKVKLDSLASKNVKYTITSSS